MRTRGEINGRGGIDIGEVNGEVQPASIKQRFIHSRAYGMSETCCGDGGSRLCCTMRRVVEIVEIVLWQGVPVRTCYSRYCMHEILNLEQNDIYVVARSSYNQVTPKQESIEVFQTT